MSKARLVITAVRLEKRPVAEVVATYGVSRAWLYRLLARYDAEGDAAFEPRSKRPRSSPTATPRSSPTATPRSVVDRVLALRKTLTGQGLDAGPHTIAWHLTQEQITLSVATVSRILTRHGAVVPDPGKRPRNSYRRFEADLPNQTWQSDFTYWQLADGRDVEILNWLDDHSRYLLACTVHRPVTGPIVVAAFRGVVAAHGLPASVLTDNGLVYTTRFAGARRGKATRNGFETELARLGVQQKNSSPNHPQTCGKVERLHQTLKQWLGRQPRARSLAEPQAQPDAFRDHYNQRRPHRAPQRQTPAAAYTARPKAAPTGIAPTHERVRRDRIDDSGVVTIRYHGRLHHIGIGRTHARTHARTHVLLLIQDLEIRIINQQTGELLRELTLDPTRDYQPQDPQTKQTDRTRRFGLSPMS